MILLRLTTGDYLVFLLLCSPWSGRPGRRVLVSVPVRTFAKFRYRVSLRVMRAAVVRPLLFSSSSSQSGAWCSQSGAVTVTSLECTSCLLCVLRHMPRWTGAYLSTAAIAVVHTCVLTAS